MKEFKGIIRNAKGAKKEIDGILSFRIIGQLDWTKNIKTSSITDVEQVSKDTAIVTTKNSIYAVAFEKESTLDTLVSYF